MEGRELMLHLKRVTHFNEWLRCMVSREYISYGDYYYEDDEDNFVVKASVYREEKLKKETEDMNNNPLLLQAKSQQDYKTALRQYEQNFYRDTLLDRKMYFKEDM